MPREITNMMLTITSTVGAWIVIALAKFWESSSGDVIMRRFVMMVAGLMLGVVAYMTSNLLMVPLHQGEMFNVYRHHAVFTDSPLSR